MSDWASSGDHVKDQTCPRCGRVTVAYNGNYSCERCPWVMGESGRPRRIVRAYLIQRWQKAKEAHDEDEMERMEGYLAPYADKKESNARS